MSVDRERELAALRDAMVEEHVMRRGIRDGRLLDALRAVPRHRFMLPATRGFAYEDHPMPIGHDQTISQPYVVAVTLLHARIEPGHRVLDVGTGSGYQAALLAELGAEVHSVERIPALAERARAVLAATGYGDRVTVHLADGYAGLPSRAPFDAIVVAAAPPAVPPALFDQLAPDARLVIPVGDHHQDLEVWTNGPAGPTREVLFAVAYVPLVPGVDAS